MLERRCPSEIFEDIQDFLPHTRNSRRCPGFVVVTDATKIGEHNDDSHDFLQQTTRWYQKFDSYSGTPTTTLDMVFCVTMGGKNTRIMAMMAFFFFFAEVSFHNKNYSFRVIQHHSTTNHTRHTTHHTPHTTHHTPHTTHNTRHTTHHTPHTTHHTQHTTHHTPHTTHKAHVGCSHFVLVIFL